MSESGQDSLPISSTDEAAGSGKAIDPKLRQAMDDKKFDTIRDNLRNGKTATAYKAQQRADYADKIRFEEGRKVRPYLVSTPERRAEQNAVAQANRRANMTPEQKNAESAARAARRAAKAQRRLVEADPATMEGHPDFGKF